MRFTLLTPFQPKEFFHTSTEDSLLLSVSPSYLGRAAKHALFYLEV